MFRFIWIVFSEGWPRIGKYFSFGLKNPWGINSSLFLVSSLSFCRGRNREKLTEGGGGGLAKTVTFVFL